MRVAWVLSGLWVALLYAWGYYQAAEKRMIGFVIGFTTGIVLLLGSLFGIILSLVRP